MAWRRGRWAGGDFYVANTFLFHQRPAVLSMWYRMVCSHMLKQSAIHVWWIKLPTSSRSLLVTWPYGLPQDNSFAVMSARKFAGHMIGYAPTGSGDVVAVLGCGWGFQGTAVGPGGTVLPHIYPEAL